MKTNFHSTILSTFWLLLSGLSAAAQIPVTLTPATNRFDTMPPSSQWSTRSQAGSGSTIGSVAAADAQAVTNSAASVPAQLSPTSGVTPAAASEAVWSSGGFIQTRPTGNAATLLLATLQNLSGHDTGHLLVRYDFAALAPTTEEAPGHRAFYSLSGAANSWQLLTSLSGGTAGAKSATLNLTNWTNGALLYLLWLDDNGSGSPDTAYQMDNFAVSFAAGPARVVTPPTSQSAAPGGAVSLNVVAEGALPIFFQWRKDETEIANATNATFNLASVQPSDAGYYSVVVSNTFGWATSAVATLTIGCAEAAAILTQPANQFLAHGATIQLAVTTAGTLPLRFQWHRDGTPLANATNQNFTKPNAVQADSGNYFVVVSNCAATVTSAVVVVSVPAPPFVLLGLTNTFWKFNAGGTNLGTEWREPAYDDAAWPSGRGVFAQEDLAAIVALTNTVLPLTNAAGAGIITYYFRTHFTLTNHPQTVVLVTSNLVDDGAVLYLNGLEFDRINMPSGAVVSGTLASGNAVEGAFTRLVIPSSYLLAGDNVLAVEVHQVSGSSSDVVFGSALILENIAEGPPFITFQPTNVNVLAGGNVALFTFANSVGATHLQWFKNGVALPDATNSLLVQTNVALHNAGDYFAVVTNSFGSTTSAVAFLNVLGGPAHLRLIEFTNLWRYDAAGTNTGTAWRAPAFNDSAWPVGRGVFYAPPRSGFPEATNTLLPLTNAAGAFITNYYFRTHLNVPVGAGPLALFSSNLLDDGAIFYLNGVEAVRLRVTEFIVTSTAAAPGEGRVYEFLTWPNVGLAAGDNVLAVVVSQTAPGSSDIVFGMNLKAYAAARRAPLLVSPPTGQGRQEGETLEILADVLASPLPSYQWFRDGSLLASATNALLSIHPVRPADAGAYHFIASNAQGSATSAVAVVTVAADTTPPWLVRASGTNGQSGLLVEFSEAVAAALATNIAHYTLGPSVSIFSAQRIAPGLVLLTTSGLDVQQDYTLTVTGISDAAQTPNFLAPGSAVRVRQNRAPFPTGLLNIETVFVILMQNQPWSLVKNHPDCPFINSLLPQAAWCENYHSPDDMHPSTPNTLWLAAGTNFGVNDNRGPDTFRAPTTNHLANQLRLAGLEWRCYAEGMPPDGTGTNNVSGSYYARQNPFTYFDDVTTDLNYFTNQVRTFDRFADDLATNGIGRYNFIIPSLTNSMDFLPPGVTSRQQAGDNFLAALVPQILGSPAWSNNGALFIVWDEDLFTLTAPVGMMLLSPHARPGHASARYADHSSLLRTWQEIFRVGPLLGGAATAQPLNDLFKDLSLRLAPSNGVAGVWLENVLPGRTNYVQASVDLLQWTTIATNTATNTVFIADPAPAPQKFYRAVEVP